MAKASSDAVRKCLLAWKADRARDKRVRAMSAATLRRWGLRSLLKRSARGGARASARSRGAGRAARRAPRGGRSRRVPLVARGREGARRRARARVGVAGGRVDAADALTTLERARRAAGATPRSSARRRASARGARPRKPSRCGAAGSSRSASTRGAAVAEHVAARRRLRAVAVRIVRGAPRRRCALDATRSARTRGAGAARAPRRSCDARARGARSRRGSKRTPAARAARRDRALPLAQLRRRDHAVPARGRLCRAAARARALAGACSRGSQRHCSRAPSADGTARTAQPGGSGARGEGGGRAREYARAARALARGGGERDARAHRRRPAPPLVAWRACARRGARNRAVAATFVARWRKLGLRRSSTRGARRVARCYARRGGRQGRAQLRARPLRALLGQLAFVDDAPDARGRIPRRARARARAAARRSRSCAGPRPHARPPPVQAPRRAAAAERAPAASTSWRRAACR